MSLRRPEGAGGEGGSGSSRPSLRLPVLLALLALPAAVARGRPVLLLLLLLADAGLFALFAWDVRRVRSGKPPRVERELPPVVSEGRPFEETLRIENPTRWPLLAELWDLLPEGFSPRASGQRALVPAGGELALHRAVVARHRGAFEPLAPSAWIRTPLGLGEVPAEAAVPPAVSVLPDLGALGRADALLRQRRLGEQGIQASRERGQGTEIAGLRPAVPGDPWSQIDWKATARRGRAVARERRAERKQLVVLAIDAGRRMAREDGGVRRLDRAVAAALALGHAALRADDRVALAAFSDRFVRSLPPLRDRRQLGLLAQALHGLEPELVEPPYAAIAAGLLARFPRRSLVVLFTDVTEPASARPLAKLARFLGRRHLVLLALFQDPSIAREAGRPPEDLPALYRAGAAADLALERQRGIAELRHAGALVFEAAGAHLPASSVNEYLRIKARGLL